jgi:type IV secretion system protein TrbL
LAARNCRGGVMFDWTIGGLGALFGWISDAAGAVTGWAWDKVITGIYQWLANGLAMMIEWVWSVLDTTTTPRVTAAWFQNDLAVRVGILALATTIAMMLASASQAALAGRPEQILDAIREGMKAIVSSALTITVLDILIGITDEASAFVWRSGRPDLVKMIEGMMTVATTTGPLATTFVGPLCMIVGFLGLIGLVISLMMRSSLIYVVAALAPIVWSLGVLPSFRGSSRKLVHLGVSLVLSKLAIVVTLVVAVKLVAHPTDGPAGPVINQASAAVGTLMAGFICFMVAAVTPMVLYRLMPSIDGAMVGSGVAGGWARGATTAASTALMVKSLGASKAASAATRAVHGQGGVAGAASGAGAGSSGGAASRSGTSSAGSPAGRATPGSMAAIDTPDKSNDKSAQPGGSDGSSTAPSRSVEKSSEPAQPPPATADADRGDDR